MKIYTPTYYKNFSCIASECRHSCCIGWEIDIDEDTYEYYKTVKGSLGERMKANISEDGCPHFILGEKERCPFLNSDNLCDIICTLGEESLCQICSDHPRYRSFFGDREELGIGLCCEEAARITVGEAEKTSLVVLEDDGIEDECSDEELRFFELRYKMLSVLQNREKSIDGRLSDLSEFCGVTDKFTDSECLSFFKDLEYMEYNIAENMSCFEKNESRTAQIKEYGTALEQLAVYFVFRHLSACLENGNVKGTAFFCILSVKIIMLMCEKHLADYGSLALSDIAEIARIYSSEIEYSEENTEKLMNLI